MKRLVQFLNEMAGANISDLDAGFLKRAQRVTSFNLKSEDFTTLKYKKEIQHLMRMHFFPGFDLDQTISGKPNKNKLNKLIKSLKSENINKFMALHNYPIKQVGPGEVTLFFLLDDASLGGGSASAADINIGGQAYEVKAGNYSARDKVFRGFKLGGTVPLEKLTAAAFKLRNIVDPNLKMGKIDKQTGEGKAERNGVNGQQIIAIMKDSKLKAQWNSQVEVPYRNLANTYLNKNPLILLVNTTPKSDIGIIYHIGAVKKAGISVDVITQGTIKQKVKL